MKMINSKDISLLFIEDEKQIRKNYVEVLKPLFKNIYEAEDGETGYAIYKEKKPEIMIVDLNIPKLNGLELIDKIREHDLSTKIIVLTAYSHEEYLIKASELKLIKYLLKPTKRKILQTTIEKAIDELNNYNISNKNLLLLKDNFIWDFNKKSLYKNMVEIELTKKEKDILQVIFQNPNIELTYNSIIESVWEDYNASCQNLKTRIMHLRKKLPKDTIETIYGIGYKFKE
jgi:two-component system response regulator VanR